jgi:redox-sensitive bicupin YhaK (pirin superfamily)
MPAVTVDDVLVLPRIPRPDPRSSPDREVGRVTTAPAGFEGEGFPVFRAFAGASLAEIDPFVHMDQMGEVDYAPGEPRGTSWHPHRGFETVTYMIDGVFDHRDSNGGGGRITDGDTQWMTAGAGILHIERPPEFLVASGGLFHGIQLWVNLPAANKWNPPRYQDLRGREAVLLTSPDGGALVRLIAGELAGHTGPGSTFTPITMLHATVSPGAELVLPWRADFSALVYVLAGRGSVGPARQPLGAHQLAVLGRARRVPGGATDAVRLSADAEQDSRHPDLEVLVLGGRPIGEPVVHYGPFVMNTREEIAQALEDFQKGRLGLVPAEELAPRRPGDDATPPGA